ncbi:thiamine biosynthesis protein ThiH [Pontibacillus halophilus JSM 076056 = DSM 19796]|uniref:Thiamine biosynthesis protein ThiH n=1 Tax=Pontibacillus halophilus JSM 076056 = DSM 19796 TaxID=1385510 RepID=A0A0A5GGQ0_9BACI|nr:2-iminoacetate synthase ThiH [Pontibacillus halophilus]KGX92416.1 thiamine biosynthesis protein ThiH [Pontibacillus halophilus JSM 076056 = DSM 19796]
MSFYQVIQELNEQPLQDKFMQVTDGEVKQVLRKDRLSVQDYFVLLSPTAENHLEEMAQLAHKRTVQHFGKTMGLFLPLYLSDYCVNTCTYCSFSIDNVFPRRILTMEEIDREARAIKERGIQHIILLTGESRRHSSVQYLKDAMEVLKKHFSSVGIEIQPLHTNEYEELVESGIDGLTVYQEVYNEEIYQDTHVKGPKRDYKYRLDTPERGCQAGMRTVNIGALLGLDDWRRETFITGLHASYLQSRYLDTEIGVSFPRIRPNAGGYEPSVNVTDRNLVQALLAYRLFMPRSGVTLSTRENPSFRDALVPLGVTKMSASSSTEVGGYTEPNSQQSQFEISDERSVNAIRELLKEKGYDPILKDWQIVE